MPADHHFGQPLKHYSVKLVYIFTNWLTKLNALMRDATHPPDALPRNTLTATRLDDLLNDLINHAGLVPGDRMPTERSLAAQFGVTRGAIRTALARMETRGVIVRSVGSGTYIAKTSTSMSPSSLPARDASPQEIMEARMLIEPQLPHLVVAHANAADLEKIRSAMLAAEQARSFDEFEDWDAIFHQAIADATHNRLVIAIYEMVTAARKVAEWGALKRRNATTKRRAEREAEHRSIFEALKSRDATLAQEAFDMHLHKVGRNLLE